ncbi:MAG: holo-ACP synthase [Clostridia bacterium]|nr:holo-ACP synthase [Clostridia bacterium]
MNVGIDILEIERFVEIEKDETKLKKMFTENEISYFNKFQFKTSHIAGTFCAKEAFVKALKTGFTKDIALLDVEVLHQDNGVPYINLNNEKIKKLLPNTEKVDISISHNQTTATAICIIF